MSKCITVIPQQPSISQFMVIHVGQYSMTHPQQKAMQYSLTWLLIATCPSLL